MSKLDEILRDFYTNPMGGAEEAKVQIKHLMLEQLGRLEDRETFDMSLGSWTPDDYKAFGRNELRLELKDKVHEL